MLSLSLALVLEVMEFVPPAVQVSEEQLYARKVITLLIGDTDTGSKLQV